MRTFLCDYCHQPLYFEDRRCNGCDHVQGFLPDEGVLSALESLADDRWTALAPEAAARPYRYCANADDGGCNWMIAADSDERFCQACRLNRTIPDLSRPANQLSWQRLEDAKRRLVYTLLALGLPLLNKDDDPKRGLAFDFLADPDPNPPFEIQEHIVTGHASGLITINIAEADDAVRERMRLDMKERYRTVLGHFRHEVAHYYWERLIRETAWLEPCRALFGDDDVDYGEALERYYQDGPPADWQDRFISAYATSHPWEDWAESFAHYLHMVDTLETAAAFGLRIRAPATGKGEVRPVSAVNIRDPDAFSTLVSGWFPLTFALNSLNRSMGLADLYPFVLTPTVADKLQFIHRVIHGDP